MQTIVQTLLPIFFIIALGYVFKKIRFPNEEFWHYLDKFTYYVLFPSLLVYKLSTAKLENIDGFDFVLTALLSIVIISFILIVLNKVVFSFKADSFTSIYQGTTRFNTYVFLALTSALFQDEGIVLAALLMTFLIPTLNLFAISIFSIYTPSKKIGLFSFIKSIVSNPLILACVFGGFLNYFQISLYNSIENTLSLLSLAALPMGLLSVGVGLQLSSIKETKVKLFLSSFLKLLFLPALMLFMGKIFDLDDLSLSILVLFAAMPTASSAYILAKQLGGDVKLMSAIITIQTIVSIFTITLILAFLI